MKSGGMVSSESLIQQLTSSSGKPDSFHILLSPSHSCWLLAPDIFPHGGKMAMAALSILSSQNCIQEPKKKRLPLPSFWTARRTFQKLPLQTLGLVSLARITNPMLILKPITGKGNEIIMICLNDQDFVPGASLPEENGSRTLEQIGSAWRAVADGGRERIEDRQAEEPAQKGYKA